MKNLFKSVLEALKTIPEIKWIDWDFEQLTAFEVPPVKFPCALFSIVNIDVSDVSGGNIYDISFRIRYGDRVYNKSNSATPDLMVEQAIAHMDMIKEITDLIEAIESDNFSKPNLTGIKPGNRVDPRYYDLIFTTNLYNYDDVPPTVKNLTLKLIKPSHPDPGTIYPQT